MEVRYTTISESSSLDDGKVPFLKLSGKWIREMGFEFGHSVRLEITPGRIIVTPAPERDRLIEQKSRQIHQLISELRVLNNNLLDLGDGDDGKRLRKHHKRRQRVLVS